MGLISRDDRNRSEVGDRRAAWKTGISFFRHVKAGHNLRSIAACPGQWGKFFFAYVKIIR